MGKNKGDGMEGDGHTNKVTTGKPYDKRRKSDKEKKGVVIGSVS